MASAMMLHPQEEAKQHSATKRHKFGLSPHLYYSKNASL